MSETHPMDYYGRIRELEARVADLEGLLANANANNRLVDAESEGLRARVAELEAEVKTLSAPCPTCGSSLFDCADCGSAALESRYGVELLARALAESEPLVSGYVRLHGRVWHLSEIHRLAQAAVAVLRECA